MRNCTIPAPLLCKLGHLIAKRYYLYTVATKLRGRLGWRHANADVAQKVSVVQGAEKLRSLSNSAGEYLTSSGPMMTTAHPSAESDCALAMAATARSRTVIATSSFLDACTMKVTGGGVCSLVFDAAP
jgi:hypothetical protein